jgi:hypothetical protein
MFGGECTVSVFKVEEYAKEVTNKKLAACMA